jgi:hypothetical protein
MKWSDWYDCFGLMSISSFLLLCILLPAVLQWDYSATKPQAAAYKAWLKKHLAVGSPVIWFPMCKGDHGEEHSQPQVLSPRALSAHKCSVLEHPQPTSDQS